MKITHVSSDRSQRRELRGITWEHERGLNPLLAAATAFEQNTGVRVRWEARTLQGFGDEPVAGLAARYDLVVLDHPHVGRLAPSGALLPLDDALAPEFLADQERNSVGPSYRSYAWDGHLWALAIDAAAIVSASRADLLAELDLEAPRTWDSVLALGRLARRRGLWIGLPLPPVDALIHLMTLCANVGAPMFADPCVVVQREAGLVALERLRALVELSHPRSWGWDPIGVLERMSTCDEVVHCPLLFGYSNYSRSGFRPHLLQFDPVASAGLGPVGGVLGGAGLAVSTQAHNLDAAVAYAAFVASGEVQRTLYVTHAGQPGHRSAWLAPDVNKACGNFFQRTLPGLDGAYLRPRHDRVLDLLLDGGEVVLRHLHGDLDGDAALDTLDAMWRATDAAERAA